MGLFERTLAFVLVWGSGQLSSAVTVLAAWQALKMLTNWNRKVDNFNPADQINLAQSALLAGTLSLAIGVVGGLIALGGDAVSPSP